MGIELNIWDSAKVNIVIIIFTVGSVSGTLKPRGRGTRPGLKISAATVTAAAATVGAVLVIGPGGAAAAGPGYAPAASDSRCTPGRRR